MTDTTLPQCIDETAARLLAYGDVAARALAITLFLSLKLKRSFGLSCRNPAEPEPSKSYDGQCERHCSAVLTAPGPRRTKS